MFGIFKRKGLFGRNVLSHNLIDHSAMSRFLGMQVSRTDFHLEEDRQKDLAPGVMWRRRRFRFFVQTDNPEQPLRPEGLCINEVWMDSQSAGELRPALAAEFPDLVDLAEIENAYWATTFAKGALRAASDAPQQKETRLYLNMGHLCFSADAPTRRKMIQDLMSLQQKKEYDENLTRRLAALDPRLVVKEAGGFGVARYLPAFPASRLVQSSGTILAATNAGYFLNFPEEYDDRVSALHQPVGGHMANGRLLAPPWLVRPGYVGFLGGAVLPGLFGPEDIVLNIEGLPPVELHRGIKGGDVQGQVWRAFDGEDLPAPAEAAAALFSGNVLVSVEAMRKGLRPPQGGAMVLLTGEHAKAALSPNGQKMITLSLREFPAGNAEWMVSAGPFLVRDAKAVSPDAMLTEAYAGEFHPGGPAPTRFPYDTGRTRAPRTSIGSLASGGMKIVVVDGRRSPEHSCGMTLEGMAHLMQWVGCETAINLDGGGSSVMAISDAEPADALLQNSAYGIVNIPSDDGGRERIVPIFLIIEAKKR